jgi:hypothetical protein
MNRLNQMLGQIFCKGKSSEQQLLMLYQIKCLQLIFSLTMGIQIFHMLTMLYELICEDLL